MLAYSKSGGSEISFLQLGSTFLLFFLIERGRMGLILRLLFTFILRMVATIVDVFTQVFIF